jgi:twinkle protein
VGVSELDGSTPVFHYYPYTKEGEVVAYKARFVPPKSMWWVGSPKGVDLFGWQQAIATGSKKLFITDGEIDALSLWQALKQKSKGTQWADHDPAVISLINGASGARADMVTLSTKIRGVFEDVIFVFDMDEAGRKAAAEASKVIPKGRTASLPAKDANECLIQGRSLALCNAVLFKAEVAKNTRIIVGSSLHAIAREPAKWGLSWPFEKLTDLTRGIRFGETHYLGAGVKMGKSEMVNTFASHLIIKHGLKVFMAKPEEANAKTYKLMMGKYEGKIFHDPKVVFDHDAFDKASAAMGDNLYLLNLYQHLGWDTLRADIHAAVSLGCKAVFIDPITNLVNGVQSGETNTILQAIAQDLAAIAKDLDIVVFIFCHLKAPETGLPHERGGKIFSHQFSGSRAMMRSCNYMYGLEGNKDENLPIEERNMRKLVVLEDREYGEVGVVNLYWDYKTSYFNEIKDR